MPGGGTPGGGSGGLPNFYPGRGYPEHGSDSFRDQPNDWVGGARGVSALPARAIVPNGPAPFDPRMGVTGAKGTISAHRGVMVEDAGAPRLCFNNVLGHGTIPWSRPFYPNVAGLHGYHAPTRMPSWSANATGEPDRPSVGIPSSRKRIANFTVRRPYGDNGEGTEFKNGSLAVWVQGIQSGMNTQGRRWLSQSKTQNPLLSFLSRYATSGSYGQTTPSLATQPTNQQNHNPYGSY